MSFDGSDDGSRVTSQGEETDSGAQVGYITDVLNAVEASNVFKQAPIFLILPPGGVGPKGEKGDPGKPGDFVLAPPIPCSQPCCKSQGREYMNKSQE
jgi:hypothetical protein